MSRPRSSRAADQLRYRLINCCSFVSGREAGHFYIGKALRSGMLAQSNSSDTAAATQKARQPIGLASRFRCLSVETCR